MPNTGPERKIQVIALIAAFSEAGDLLLLRRPENVHCGGLWSFPGGKVERNESAEQTAMRELKEEAGLCGEDWQHLGDTTHAYEDRTLNLRLFTCLCPDISEINCESEYKWVGRNDLEELPMPEANALLTPMLLLPEMDDYWGYEQP